MATVLDFEKPILEIQEKIEELKIAFLLINLFNKSEYRKSPYRN